MSAAVAANSKREMSLSHCIIRRSRNDAQGQNVPISHLCRMSEVFPIASQIATGKLLSWEQIPSDVRCDFQFQPIYLCAEITRLPITDQSAPQQKVVGVRTHDAS